MSAAHLAVARLPASDAPSFTIRASDLGRAHVRLCDGTPISPGRARGPSRVGLGARRADGPVAQRCTPMASSISAIVSVNGPANGQARGGGDGGAPLVDRVAVVGGGLGGLAAAIALRKRGIDAHVYERNASISGGEGTLISLFANGLWALQDACPDLIPQLKAAGNVDPECLTISADDKIVADWGAGSTMSTTYGLPMLAIRWRAVLDALAASLPPACIHTGHKLLHISQDDAKVVATFKTAEGEAVIETPLLLGADGIRSAVRASVLGTMLPRDNGRTIWRAIIDFDLVEHPLLKRKRVMGGASNGITAVIADASLGKLYWGYTVTDSSSNGDAARRSASQEEMKHRVLTYFEHWGLARAIVEATDADLILERRVLDMDVLDDFVHGRVVLIGDAAHAVTPALGQGANLAFEDGQEIAHQLVTRPSLREALDTYHRVRQLRVKAVCAMNKAATKKTYTAPGTATEQPKFNMSDYHGWLYGYRGSAMPPTHESTLDTAELLQMLKI
eukprot:SM000062S19955  [mRNA]  locus=s62:580934:583536:+ [translate_table: standard]